jgi:hypothetical protein
MYDLSPLEAAASLIIIKIKKHNQDLEYFYGNGKYSRIAEVSIVYSQTCIKRSPLGQRKKVALSDIRSLKRVSIHMNYFMTGQ